MGVNYIHPQSLTDGTWSHDEFPSSESPNFQGSPIFRWTMLNFRGVVQRPSKTKISVGFVPRSAQASLEAMKAGPVGLKIPPKTAIRNASFILPFPKRTASLHLKMDGLGVGRLLQFHCFGALPIFIRYVSFWEGTSWKTEICPNNKQTLGKAGFLNHQRYDE